MTENDSTNPSMEDVVAFLLGEGPLHGSWFGDTRPPDTQGNYWWRSHLRKAFSASSTNAAAPQISVEPRIVMPGPDRSDPEIWLQAWLNVAGASNSTNRESADAWADHCLVQYKKRFRA